MRRSLRIRLQLWYAGVLLAVVVGFAAILYQRVRSARLSEIDRGLQAQAEYLDSNLRHFPPRDLEGTNGEGSTPPASRPAPPPNRPGPPPDHFRPPDPLERDRFPHPPPDRRPGPGTPPGGEFNRERALADLDLTITTGLDAEVWFVILRSDGTMIKASSLPEGMPTPPPLDPSTPQLHLARQGEYRVASRMGPHLTSIIVGRSLRRDMAALQTFAWQLTGVGAVVLVVGLAGGWVASGQFLRPLATISATAASISAANLSARIDPARVDREMSDLVGVLNAMFARLEAAFERQTRFTADASHELRTPLAVLRTNAELALTRPRTADEYRQALETCLRTASRMSGLVDGLLALARADADALELRREPVDLRRTVRECVDSLLPLARERDVKVALRLDDVKVLGDGDRLTQVVTNLVTNALQHNRPGGAVTVGLTAQEGRAVLSVADTGKGIPEADQGHLFERFFRVDKARTRTAGGNGLGLAICKSIVTAHGGTIDFDSHEGSGSTFRVRLEAYQE